jgi:hypothetical protein
MNWRLNWVIDIGIATQMLKEVLQTYNYKNLDDFFKENSTTEFMCKEVGWIYERIHDREAARKPYCLGFVSWIDLIVNRQITIE